MALTPEKYRPRLAEHELSVLLQTFGAVCIEGPKWCGKTWIGLNSSNSAFMIGDINEYGQGNKELAEMNLGLALVGEKPHLIDEWQDVPKVWDAVRSQVDRSGAKGQFILTGSSSPKHFKPQHSGTGRIAHLRIRTLSLYESGESTGSVSLSKILKNESIGIIRNPVSLEMLAESILSGGWPANLELPYELRTKSIRAYLDSILLDASVFDGKTRRLEGIRLVFNSLARNECTLASNTKIHSDTGIPLGDGTKEVSESKNEKSHVSYDSVIEYIDVLDRLFLINNQPAFDPNIKSSVRVGKTVKRHLVDPSLAAAALGLSKEHLMKDLKVFGCLFESLCERDLQIYASDLGGKLYHYRDDSGMEVDAVVESADGSWAAFEIKLGANKIDEAAENLKKFREKMEKHNADSLPSVLCVICGLTEYSYVREDGVWVVSINSLGP